MNTNKHKKDKLLENDITRTIDDEILRYRVRKTIDEPKPEPLWKRISTNSLTSLFLGFLLTGLVGAFLTNFYNTKQKELEFQLSNIQRDKEREKDARQRDLEREKDERQKDLEFERHKQALERDREHDSRQKDLEFQRSLYQKELERERSFADELNRVRIQKIGEVWEKVYEFEAFAQEIYSKMPNMGADMQNVTKEPLDKSLELSQEVYSHRQALQSAAIKNRFWIGEKTYSKIIQYVWNVNRYVRLAKAVQEERFDKDLVAFQILQERRKKPNLSKEEQKQFDEALTKYSPAEIDNLSFREARLRMTEERLTKLRSQREELRASLTQLRNKLLRE